MNKNNNWIYDNDHSRGGWEIISNYQTFLGFFLQCAKPICLALESPKTIFVFTPNPIYIHTCFTLHIPTFNSQLSAIRTVLVKFGANRNWKLLGGCCVQFQAVTFISQELYGVRVLCKSWWSLSLSQDVPSSWNLNGWVESFWD